jgi:hypothetical protein
MDDAAGAPAILYIYLPDDSAASQADLAGLLCQMNASAAHGKN